MAVDSAPRFSRGAMAASGLCTGIQRTAPDSGGSAAEASMI